MPGKNILVIDDDDKTISGMIETLESEGYAVFTASNKAKSVELISKVRPVLIFVNAILTDSSGLDVTRTIRKMESLEDIPFIMMTEMEEEYSERYKSTYGIIDFLKKPIDPNELITKTVSTVSPEEDLSVAADHGDEMKSEGITDFGLPDEEMEKTHAETEDMGALAFQSFEESGGMDDFGMQDKEYGETPSQETGEAMDFKQFEMSGDVGSQESEESEVTQQLEGEEIGLREDTAAGEQTLVEKSYFTTPGTEDEKWEDFDKESGTGADAEDDLFIEEAVDRKIKKPVGASMVKGNRSRDTGKEKRIIFAGLAVSVLVVSGIIAGYMFFMRGGGNEADIDTLVRAEKEEKVRKGVPVPEVTGKGTRPVTPSKDTVAEAEVQIPERRADEKTEGEKETGTDQKAASAKQVVKPSRVVRSAKYSLQAGFYRNLYNANKLHDKLKKMGYEVSVKEVTYKGGVGYRVLIGRYNSRKEALRTREKIKSIEKLNTVLYKL